jgi:hypothetical protein
MSDKMSSAAIRSAEIQTGAAVLTVALVSPTMCRAILGAGGFPNALEAFTASQGENT